ncbi:MAG: DUF5320 domain-containing protein [Candidatus Omnitrophica bacterium]|nr:DUF5320 domain-containing protein [Candidatus Omnitrophota bacterium]
MPGFDGTGPMGMGPMTGGVRGFCVSSVYGTGRRPFGRRLFFGRGGGRGWRNRYYETGLPGWARAGYGYPAFGIGYAPAFSKEEEAAMLKEEAELLKEELRAVQERLDALGKTQGAQRADE